MSPFAPIGDRARWAVVYDVLLEHKVGDIVTYEDLGAALDLDPVKERHPIQMAMRRAAQVFESEDRQSVEATPNVGYRIIEAAEHLELAKTHQAKASKSLVRGHSAVVNTDITGFDPALRRVFEVTATALSYQMDLMRRLDVRVRSTEKAVAEMAETRNRTDEEVAELRARLERLEQRDQAVDEGEGA